MSFPKIDPKQSFPKMEEEILAFWQKEKIFEKSLEKDAPAGEFKFFDGPPFATGLPHYGHILQGVIKDLIPRYKTMRGYKVPRVWGWDCHGLPVENLIEKELNLSSKKDIEDFGVAKFNEKCRESVLRFAGEWQKTVARMGRWIDMEHAYKTMDLNYMDSVWWVFGELWKKGLIYEGLKPMHVCPRCATPLSISEVGMNYRDVTDLSATAKFELEDEPGTFLLAWTTTPWTLPGNVALAVSPKIEYLKIKVDIFQFKNGDKTFQDNQSFDPKKEPPEKPIKTGEETYIASRKFFDNDWAQHGRFETYYGTKNFTVIEGKKLIGKTYKPLFPYFADQKSKGAFRIVGADFVTTEEGTGIVHIAPAFGEDDYNLAKKENLPIVKNVSLDGKFLESARDFAGLEVKPTKNPRETDEKIVKFLGDKIFATQNYKHSYPFCWRCESPLLNYATSSWFVAVEKIKKGLLAGNEKINWIPEHIKNGRFGKWLEGARDWAISRNRFWGAPLPIWRCEKCDELKCLSSKAELEKLSGEKVADLHKHFVDEIEIDCEKCKGKMQRIPEVLDCWFESGSMPFAQFSEKAKAKIPADFIAEAQDQTRGWFYTLHVLGTALKNAPVFANCVCSGLILAEDGAKMSKSKNNFPPPQKIFDNYGADAMRLYLMNSPVVHAADLRFSEKGVEEILRGILLPLWNTFYFFTTYANADGWSPAELPKKLENPLDRWILSELNILVREMTEHLEKYEIQKAVAPLADFLDGLTNWYVRRSRRRFWKSESDQDKAEAYATLFEVLKTVAKLLAPITPFLAEKIWQNLTGGESVHLENWPEVDKSKIDENLSEEVNTTRKIISLGLKIRANEKIKVRQPLAKATVALPMETNLENLKKQKEVILEELNIKKLELKIGSVGEFAKMTVTIDPRLVGPKFPNKIQEIIQDAKRARFIPEDGQIKICGEILSEEEFSIKWIGKPGLSVESDDGIAVLLDTTITPELELEGRARDLVRIIQDLRKQADFEVSDRIELQLENADDILAKFAEYIATETLAEKVSNKVDSPAAEGILEKIKVGVKKIS
ncbi:MAG: class I tRNA ligase family protein [Patescibacteria group bacterium]